MNADICSCIFDPIEADISGCIVFLRIAPGLVPGQHGAVPIHCCRCKGELSCRHGTTCQSLMCCQIHMADGIVYICEGRIRTADHVLLDLQRSLSVVSHIYRHDHCLGIICHSGSSAACFCDLVIMRTDIRQRVIDSIESHFSVDVIRLCVAPYGLSCFRLNCISCRIFDLCSREAECPCCEFLVLQHLICLQLYFAFGAVLISEFSRIRSTVSDYFPGYFQIAVFDIIFHGHLVCDSCSRVFHAVSGTVHRIFRYELCYFVIMNADICSCIFDPIEADISGCIVFLRIAPGLVPGQHGAVPIHCCRCKGELSCRHGTTCQSLMCCQIHMADGIVYICEGRIRTADHVLLDLQRSLSVVSHIYRHDHCLGIICHSGSSAACFCDLVIMRTDIRQRVIDSIESHFSVDVIRLCVAPYGLSCFRLNCSSCRIFDLCGREAECPCCEFLVLQHLICLQLYFAFGTVSVGEYCIVALDYTSGHGKAAVVFIIGNCHLDYNFFCRICYSVFDIIDSPVRHYLGDLIKMIPDIGRFIIDPLEADISGCIVFLRIAPGLVPGQHGAVPIHCCRCKGELSCFEFFILQRLCCRQIYIAAGSKCIGDADAAVSRQCSVEIIFMALESAGAVEQVVHYRIPVDIASVAVDIEVHFRSQYAAVEGCASCHRQFAAVSEIENGLCCQALCSPRGIICSDGTVAAAGFNIYYYRTG